MPTWPRAILPATISPLMMGGALSAWSDTGKAQHRATGHVGRTWVESYPPFQPNTVNGSALIAFINNMWRNGTTFTIDHRHHLVHLGSGGGTVLVAGGSQTGTSLNTDGWTGTNPVLRAGDIISIAGVVGVRDITADAPNLFGDAVTLGINPPIFVGSSPADNAVITYTGVTLNALIAEPPNMPAAGVDQYIAGLTIVFREAP